MTTDPTAGVRRAFYLVVGTLAVAAGLGRLAGVENVVEPSRYAPPPDAHFGTGRHPALTPKRDWPPIRPEPTPAFGSNDRSRWMTVAALVETGTYAIGTRTNFRAETGYADRGLVARPEYKSLDIVMNPATGEFYSSKPPLYSDDRCWRVSTAVLKHGVRLGPWSADRWPVTCHAFSSLVNVLPFAVYLWPAWRT